MAEIAPGGGGPNRLFVVLAVGLAGLLVLGLVAVGGVLLIPKIINPAPAPAKVATTPTRVAQATTVPTDTPVPTEAATPTLVGAGSLATPTSDISGTPASGQLPKSGLGEDLILLSAGIVLVLIVFAARRARTT
jgi:hypothetical protein